MTLSQLTMGVCHPSALGSRSFFLPEVGERKEKIALKAYTIFDIVLLHAIWVYIFGTYCILLYTTVLILSYNTRIRVFDE